MWKNVTMPSNIRQVNKLSIYISVKPIILCYYLLGKLETESHLSIITKQYKSYFIIFMYDFGVKNIFS